MLCLAVLFARTQAWSSPAAPASAVCALGTPSSEDDNDDKHLPTRPGAGTPKRKPVRKGIVGEVPPIKTLPIRPVKLPFQPVAFNDPIRFTMTANKDSLAIGEEVEITIRAELLPITSSMMFFFEEQRSFSLKVLMPEGFVQTGGNYYDYVGGTLRAENATQTITLKGHQTTNLRKGSCFSILRGSLTAGPTELLVKKGDICLKLAKIAGSARLANSYVSNNCSGPYPCFSPSAPRACPNGTVDVEVYCPSGYVMWTDGTGYANPRPLGVGTFTAKCMDYSGTVLYQRSISVTTNNDSPPTPTTTGDTECAGSQFTLNAAGCTTYQWYDDEGFITGVTTATYQPTLNGNTDFYVACVDECGRESATRTKVTGTVIPYLSIGTSNNGANLCPGNTVALSAWEINGISGVSYSWKTANNQPVTDPNSVGNGVYTVTASKSGYCNTTAQTTVSIPGLNGITGT